MQPPFGVGQQNRIGNSVDDVVEQRALVPLLAVALVHRFLPEDLIELLGEHRREPLKLARQRRHAADQHQAERVVALARNAQRDDVERRVLERRRRTAPAIAARMGRRKEAGALVGDDIDERIAPVVQ